MKLFTAPKIREIDKFTIENEPINSIDLMERAAHALHKWFIENMDRSQPVIIFTGPGNNGGDGLAMARMLYDSRYSVEVCHLDFTDKTTEDWKINRDRLLSSQIKITYLKNSKDIPIIPYETIIVDAIFGTGLDRKLEGLPADVVRHINNLDSKIISVDIPSGLFSEDNSSNDSEAIVHADITLTLQFPKLSFFMADCFEFIGKTRVLPIGLHSRGIREMPSEYCVLEKDMVAPLLKKIRKFDHKGDNGHGLMVSGSCGKVGAAMLSSLAALRTGVGLLTVHIPRQATNIVHASVPEVMVQCDESDILVSEIYDTDRYNAIGIGPGLGTKPNTVKALTGLIENYKGPMVIDADGLNIISENKSLLNNLSPDTILTPHPGEFERLVGKSKNSFQRMQKQREVAKSCGCIIVLKGANTSIALPDGRIWFNSTGNPGMATAGSGDVLTGMILSLLAQGYCGADAALLGVYIHGLAGDIAAEERGFESLIASDIINNIGLSFIRIRKDI